MQILVNSNDEILSFAIIGGFENGIEVANYPNDFINNFKPRYYLFNGGQIEVNKNYKDENEVFPPIELPSSNNFGTDEELRVMFATMQVQLVQANTMVMQLSQQNANLSQEVVSIKQKLEEVTNNEDVVSEV